jgi:hypothetical protein
VNVDNRIAASILDAVYIGKDKSSFVINEEYRFKALRSATGAVKIKIGKIENDILVYKNQTEFYNNWSGVRKVAEGLW